MTEETYAGKDRQPWEKPGKTFLPGDSERQVYIILNERKQATRAYISPFTLDLYSKNVCDFIRDETKRLIDFYKPAAKSEVIKPQNNITFFQ